jgi:hypothetical protein
MPSGFDEIAIFTHLNPLFFAWVKRDSAWGKILSECRQGFMVQI